MSRVTDQEKSRCSHIVYRGQQCCDSASWLSSAGDPVCGTHRNMLDLANERLGNNIRCTPINPKAPTAKQLRNLLWSAVNLMPIDTQPRLDFIATATGTLQDFDSIMGAS